MFLNNTDPVYTLTDLFNSTTPTSSVFTVGQQTIEQILMVKNMSLIVLRYKRP